MLAVKPCLQKPGQCGPTCLKMILDFYGVGKTVEEISDLMKCNPQKGVSGKAIIKAAKALGFIAEIKDEATFRDIRNLVTEKRMPVIIDWFSCDDGHYSVIIGIDKTHIYLQDPNEGRVVTYSLEVFKRIWFDFDAPFIRTKKDLILRRIIIIQPKSR